MKLIASHLRDLVQQHGRHLYGDARRCEALLRDACPAEKREIHLLVCAVRERIPDDLIAHRQKIAPAVLTKRLTDLGLAVESAHWAVATWSEALDVPLSHQPMAPSAQPRSHTAAPVAERAAGVSAPLMEIARLMLLVVNIAMAHAAGEWVLDSAYTMTNESTSAPIAVSTEVAVVFVAQDVFLPKAAPSETEKSEELKEAAPAETAATPQEALSTEEGTNLYVTLGGISGAAWGLAAWLITLRQRRPVISAILMFSGLLVAVAAGHYLYDYRLLMGGSQLATHFGAVAGFVLACEWIALVLLSRKIPALLACSSISFLVLIVYAILFHLSHPMFEASIPLRVLDALLVASYGLFGYVLSQLPYGFVAHHAVSPPQIA